MRILVTGVSGFVGSELAPRLTRDGHDVRGFARDRGRVAIDVPIVEGDVLTGAGLAEALEGVDVAYFLIHSMEAAAHDGTFADRELRGAQSFSRAARRAGVERIVYLGGLVPEGGRSSAHLASRLEVEETLLAGAPGSVALRASIVIGARSRSFRFMVRLIERLPVLALPGWREHRTQPIDARDMIEYLARAATAPQVAGQSLDVAGRDVLRYGQMIDRIREAMLVGRPTFALGGVTATPLTSHVAAAIAGEDHELVGPLMESLEYDLLPRDERARSLLGVRLHSFDAAVERALRDWERTEPLAAR